MKSGIYCIENIVNGKKYIGQSIDVQKRMSFYHRGCYALNGAIKKYGKENFKSRVLIICEKEELNRLEIECIRMFNSHVLENGYNISLGGHAPMAGRTLSKEGRKKLSEQRVGENNPQFGIPISDETKKKIRIATSGEKNHRFGKKNPNASSKYYGIRKTSDGRAWEVKLSVDGRSVYAGRSKDETETAKLYDNYIIENNLPNPLNFPQ